jgi:LDH2 family malate/lactate/ureidoglycolate dehydrogenase
MHGVPQYRRQLLEGGANPKASLRIEAQFGGVTRLDAEGGLGPLMAQRAMELSITHAKQHGVAFTTVRNANHFGAAGHFALQAAEVGCVAMVGSNTPPIMAVTGSSKRSIGNSPLGFAAPRAGGPPVVLDIAMSRVAGGKIRLALQSGTQVPHGWILDPEGVSTQDPADFLEHRGALLPMGEHKGYGLALMVESLAAAMSGSAMLHAVGNWIYTPEKPSDTGYFMMVIDASDSSVFEGTDVRIAQMCREISESPLAAGFDRIVIPGDLESEHERRTRKSGLAMSESAWAPLRLLAQDLSIALSSDLS